MGEKVLVVDCDLRRGRQHALLRLDNSTGMSHMLTGRIKPGEAVQNTGPNGFDAIPRGPILPGASELLCRESFLKLVQYWRSRYDRVILDCPPVLGLSESASLQRLADGVVLVVRSEATAMKDVRDAINTLRKTGAHFFGFVLNGVDLSKIGNYYQYYYYSAPYYDQFEESPEEPRYVRAKSRKKPASAAPESPATKPDSTRTGGNEFTQATEEDSSTPLFQMPLPRVAQTPDSSPPPVPVDSEPLPPATFPPPSEGRRKSFGWRKSFPEDGKRLQTVEAERPLEKDKV
jgi:capsular exopolysaccharide synthesis family protein